MTKCGCRSRVFDVTSQDMFYIVFTILAFLNSSRLYASAWPLKYQELFLMGKVMQFQGDDFYSRKGQSQSTPSFRKQSFEIFYEYGKTSKITLGGRHELYKLTQRDISSSGLGDSEFWVRNNFYEKNSLVGSGQLTLLVPGTYDFPLDFLVPGDGSMHVEARGLLGKSWMMSMGSLFIDTSLAYRARLGHSKDQIRSELNLGGKIGKHGLSWQNFLTYSMGPLSNSVFDYHLLRTGFSYFYQINSTDVFQVSYFKDVWGRNVLVGDMVLFAFGRSF